MQQGATAPRMTSGLIQAQTASRKGDVSCQIERLAVLSKAIEERIENLEGRLNQVLRPACPAAAGQGLDKRSLVDLANTLSSLADSLDSSMARLTEMHDRIEL